MDPVPISVTEASRNFSECVNRARYQGTSFVLLKGGSPVARIEPAEAQPKRGRELAAAFVKAVEGVQLARKRLLHGCTIWSRRAERKAAVEILARGVSSRCRCDHPVRAQGLRSSAAGFARILTMEIKLAAITVSRALTRSVERATGVRRARRQKCCNTRSRCLRSFRSAKRLL